MPPDDPQYMRCERWFEAVSALVDGEDPGVDHRLLLAHVTDCAECKSAWDRLERLRRAVRVMPAEPMPDMSGRVMKAVAFADRASRWLVVRVLLAAIALYTITVSIVTVLVAEESGSSMHGARHIGAFTLAYGASLLVVVARPARAGTMLPVAATLAIALAITAVFDVMDGQVPLTGEVLHVPELVSVGLLWLLAVPALHRPSGHGRREAQGPTLRLVDQRAQDGQAVAESDSHAV